MKYTNDIYTENYKILPREINKDLNNWRNMLVRVNIAEIVIAPKLICQINEIFRDLNLVEIDK